MLSDDLIAIALRHLEGVDQRFMRDVQYPFDLAFRTTLNQVEAQKWHHHSPCEPKDVACCARQTQGETETAGRLFAGPADLSRPSANRPAAQVCNGPLA